MDEHSVAICEELEPLTRVSTREHKLSGHITQIVFNGHNTEVTQVLCIVAVEQREVAMLDDVLRVLGKFVKVEVVVAEDGATAVMDVHDVSFTKLALGIIGSSAKSARCGEELDFGRKTNHDVVVLG